MRQFLKKHNDFVSIIIILLFWRIYLLFIQSIAFVYPQRIGYLGFIPEGNFDGNFYIAISQYWYRGLDQAFFPLYPVAIKGVSSLFYSQSAASGIIVSIISLFTFLFFLKKLLFQDKFEKYVFWTIFFYLFFPTSFFLASIYTESLFLALVIISFYFLRIKKYYSSAIFAMLASATRIVGIFLFPVFIYELYIQNKEKNENFKVKKYIPLLLIPLGIISYMSFLWYKYKDPLLFVHIQPSFGAGRSGGEIIFLPQVIFRYIKIIFTVQPNNLTFFISIFEFTILITFTVLLILAFKKGIRKSYILFSFIALYFPTISGSLSSLPRYVLSCFAAFIFLGLIKNKYLKIALLVISTVAEVIISILFLRGYFVS